MFRIIIIMFFTVIAFTANSQKYITKNGHIKFYSETPIETIEAHNSQVNCALDRSSGDFVFKVLMKSFEFEKALMQEHFNENYVESDKFPNAIFQGKVTNISDLDFTTDGEYKTIVEGELTIHGVTNKVKQEGTFTVKNGVVNGTSVFNVKPSDYNIRIPKTVINNIAEDIEVTVDVPLEEFKK